MRYRRLGGATGLDYVFGAGPGEFLVNSPAAVAQAILTRLKLWQGEWFLDTTIGTPYQTQILGFGTTNVYDAAIQNVILNTQGVIALVKYSSSLNRATRALSVTATVDTQYGSTPVTITL